MDGWILDFRHAARRLSKEPGFTAVAALTLALGVGGATAMAASVLGALALGRLLAGLLFGATPSDPVTLASVGGVMLFVALLAGLVPARRAAGVDPAAALRQE